MKSLEQRFIEFFSRVQGTESLDAEMFRELFGASRRADFLLKDREAIVEVKTLKIDPVYKVEARLAVHRNRPEFPLYFWRAELSEILKHLPDGEAIKKDIFRALTNSVQNAFRSANDQIRETKRILNLPKSCGILVVLNENVEILRPDYVTARANAMILEAKNDSLRFPEIAYVWIFSETHSRKVGTVLQGAPIILLEEPQSDHSPELGDYLVIVERTLGEAVTIAAISRQNREF